MTPFELVGVVALGSAAGALVYRTMHKIFIAEASKHIDYAVREAFENGMLCAADMITMEGQEVIAGDIRKAIEVVRTTNRNSHS